MVKMRLLESVPIRRPAEVCPKQFEEIVRTCRLSSQTGTPEYVQTLLPRFRRYVKIDDTHQESSRNRIPRGTHVILQNQ